MKFRILHSGENDVKEKAESLSKVLTDRTPKPAFSGILIIHGVEDVQKACMFLQSDFEGTTIFILDRDFLSLTENRKAFKLFQKIKEYLYPRRNSRVLFINHNVSEEALEEFKKDFDLSDNFVHALVHFTEITEIANYLYRLMHHGGPMESNEEPLNLPTGLVRNLTDPDLDSSNWKTMSVSSLQNAPPVSRLPSYYLPQNSPPDSASSGLHNMRRPMEHYCSISSDSGSADGSRQPPVGDSAPVSFNKRSSRSLPEPTSPPPPQHPVTFRSEPAASARPQVMANNPGQATGYNPGQVTGSNPIKVTGYNPGQVPRYDPGQVTGYNPGQAARNFPGLVIGYNPGQVTGYNSGQVTGYNPGLVMGYNPGQAARNNPGQVTGYNPGQAARNYPGQVTGYNSGQVTGYDLGQVTGYNPGQVTGYNSGQVTGYDLGQVTGYNPGQVTGYNSGQVTGYNPGQVTGYNSGQVTEYNSGQVTGYDPGQAARNNPGHMTGNTSEQQTIQLMQQRVPEQNQQEEEDFPSEEIFLSNCQQQQYYLSNPQGVVMEKYVLPVPNQGAVSVNPNENCSTDRLSGVQFISQDQLSTESQMVSSYVHGDMTHLLDDLGDNALPNSLYNSGFCVDCKKSKDPSAVNVSPNAAQSKDFFTDESVAPFSTFGPRALNNVCEECSQKRQNKKSDSIPSLDSSTVNSMILSDASRKLGNSRNSGLSQNSHSGQCDQQSQRSFQGQMSHEGQELNQGQMSQGQRSVLGQMSQGHGLNQSQMVQRQMSQGQRLNQSQMVQRQMSQSQRLNQGQMSQGQRLNQRQVSQDRLAERTQMEQIVMGMSNIRFPGPRDVAPSQTQQQVSGIVHAYTDRRCDPNSEQGQYNQTMVPNSQNLCGQGFPTMAAYSPNLGGLGLQPTAANPQSQVRGGESTMPSNQTNFGSQAEKVAGKRQNVSVQRMALPQGMTSSQRMTSSLGMTSPQRMNLAQRMTSMPTIGMPELEMNFLSNLSGAGGGTSRGLQSLPSNLDSHTAGFLGPNIRLGDPENHSSMQSETDNRDFDDRLNGDTAGPHRREVRGTRTSNTRNTNGQRGRDDGASGGMDPGPTNDAVGAENQVDIHELAFPVFELIRDQLDCAQMYNWRNLADLHGLNYRQIQDIEQLWKNHRITSPFEHLILTFQRYSVQQLRDDLRKIPRCDLLDRLKKLEIDGKLPASCAGLFTSPS